MGRQWASLEKAQAIPSLPVIFKTLSSFCTSHLAPAFPAHFLLSSQQHSVSEGEKAWVSAHHGASCLPASPGKALQLSSVGVVVGGWMVTVVSGSKRKWAK